MSLFEQFPYTNFHEINLDWLIQQVKNYGESVVLSVNGQTGDVVLYQDPNIVFPSVDNTNWTMTRTANGHEIGIQFQNGMAYLLFDGSAERIYTTVNPPAYPVTSVDGQTGAVQVFPDADTVLPPVDNTRTIMRRQIKDGNNQDIFTGVQAEADALKRLSGTNLYTIYDQQNQPPYPVTSVNSQTGAVVLAIPFADVSGQEWTASEDSPSNIWEMSRYTQNGALATIRLTTANGLTEGYLEYFDEGTQTTVTKKILTTDDIPSSAGVVSLNGLTGVVTLYGSTMDLYSGSPDTVKDAIDFTRSSVAYREDGATASQNIPAGKYVIWQGEPYISTAAISAGDTLSGSNLSAKPTGITNALRTDIDSLTNQMNHIGVLNTNVSFGPTSISSGSFVTLASPTPPEAGRYLFIANVNFPAGTGIRILLVDSSETDINTPINSVLAEGRATLEKVVVFSLSTTDHVYIRAYQTSGSAMSVNGSYRFIRLS